MNKPGYLQSSAAPAAIVELHRAGDTSSAASLTERETPVSETTASSLLAHLLGAMDAFNQLLVMWGPDDRLVMSNVQFREFNAGIPHAVEPGTPFETYLRAALGADLLAVSADRHEEWLRERLERHRAPRESAELECRDGRWLLVREHRLDDGSTVGIASDITARKRVEASLLEGHRVLHTALSTIPDGVHVLDADLQMTAWNDKLWEVMDLDGESILASDNPGKAFRYALAGRGEYGEGDLDTLVSRREEMARSPVPVRYERQLVTGKWIECRGTPVPGGGYVAIYRDMTELRKQEELERLAAFDDLTGVRNRRSFLEILGGEIDRSLRYGRILSVLVIDVDWFKAVNDRYGHAAGDQVLRRTAEVLAGGLRSVDTLSRYGGEEFALLLPESIERQSVGVAERLRIAVETLKVPINATPVSVTVSVGVAEIRPGDNIESLLARADAALYTAKKNGRNQVALARS